MVTNTITPAPRQYDPVGLEKNITQYWAEVDAYKKTKAHREGGEDFYFIDGPPYTSGAIHLGTAWNKILKDAVIRYLRMHNYNVRDQAGFDMHGLPIEVRVEQTLGIKNKKQIEEYGMDNFISKCREFALKFKDTMTEQFKALGVWLDWENPYTTITNQYIEAAWWTLRRADERGLLTRSERVLPWCPRCETALAEAEIRYWDERDPSIYVKFPVEGREGEYIVIWTTTPWTLPADLAVAVHPDFNYVRACGELPVRGGVKETLILIEERLQEVAQLGGYKNIEIVERLRGEDLEGLKYIHPLRDEVPYQQKDLGFWLHKIVLAEYVTAENTGCVHTAPGHGPDDFDTGRRYDLPPFSPVDETGTFTAEAGKYKGMFTKDADPVILQDLKNKGLILHQDEIVHRYGHCWRCKTPITYRTTEQWFLKVTELRTKMLEEIGRAKWTPEWAGSARFYDWVENTRDWCISRQRYWGIPMPIWVCECGERVIIGSEAELLERKGVVGYREGMELHRPWIDAVKLKCTKCEKLMSRVPDVLDVWFDSAICSWAQLGFPADSTDFDRWWPCRWITEAHDQTRGWFYSQLGASVIAFDRIPYESVLMHGFALDKNGRPMSKSLGTSISPFEITSKYGVDAFRFYILRASAPWEDLPFSIDGVRSAHRTLNILWNCYVFATTYMALDNYDPSATTYQSVREHLKPEDAWLLSRVEHLKQEVNKHFEKFNLHKVCRALEHFILEDLSRLYIRLVRDRTWVEEVTPDKHAAYFTLHYALLCIAKLLAPIVPFLAEEFYRNLDASLPTVHMCDWVGVEKKLINEPLEAHMVIVREIIEATASARQRANLKLRHPCKRIIIQAQHGRDDVLEAVSGLENVLKNQTNTKEVRTLAPGTQWDELSISIQPNLSVLGPRFRKDAPKVAEIIQSWNSLNEDDLRLIKKSITGAEKSYTAVVDGKTVEITEDMVVFETRLPAHIIKSDFSGGTVYLDTELTPELKAEAFARELIRRIQYMRKELDLSVEEYIHTEVKVPPSTELDKSLRDWGEFISTETRSKSLKISTAAVPPPGGELVKSWDIDGESVVIGVRKD